VKKNLLVFLILLILFLSHIRCFAQLTPEELAERTKWEEFLKTAEIIDNRQMTGPYAVTNPYVLTLRKDNITRNALWKNPEGKFKGSLEGWNYEIAAYRLDKYLELNMIPPTVEKIFKGKRGSCQLWMESKMSLREKEKQKIAVPRNCITSWNRALYLQRAFDCLIANEDRHQGNILITEDWRMILIDHSRCFRSSKKFTEKLIFDLGGEGKYYYIMPLPKTFVENIETLNFQLIKDIVGNYLTDKEIQAILMRKELILRKIDRLIERYGEDTVLY
jgi:hypothetical protein